MTNIDLFAGGGGSGWNDAWCYPQMHQFLLPLIKPGDRVLDIGAGIGRSSFPLALLGADVFFVDTDDNAIAEAAFIYQEAGLNFSAESFLDALAYLKNSSTKFDTIILSETLVHNLKSVGIEIIKEAINHCTGNIFIAVPSVFSWSFESLRELNYGNPEPCTFLSVCDCSGIDKIEPFSYYFPGEIESLIISSGGRIIIAETYENHSGNYAWVIVATFR